MKKKLNVITICLVLIAFFMGIIVDRSIGLNVNNSNKEATVYDSVFSIMLNNWYFGKDKENLQESLTLSSIKGMVDAQGDPHTVYMTPSEVQEFNNQLDNTLVGIGVNYSSLYGKALIRRVLADSPALKAGLLAGDIMTKVDGKSIAGMDTTEIKNLIAGQEGTPVKVTVLRDGKEKEFEIIRGSILTSVYHQIVDGVGYVNINSFSTLTAQELKGHLDELVSNGVTRLILDIRGNGGGYLNTLVTIASYFIDQGLPILYEEFRDGSKEATNAIGGKYNFENIIILIDNASASCSEVFAAAMHYHNGTTLIGKTTYGKGTVQVSAGFSDGSAIKYTKAAWFSPEMKTIDGQGITPDYDIDLPEVFTSYISIVDDDVEIKYDSVDELVKKSQQMLDVLGYKVNRQDGYFDQSTKNAVLAFQKDYKLKETGTLNKETIEKLTFKLLYQWDTNQFTYDTQFQKAMELINE